MSVAKVQMRRLPTRQTGVTLIETLVAGVVLAIGILGIVSLMAFAKVSHHDSIQRTRAVALGDDILERIRRNPEGMSVYDDRNVANPIGGSSITAQPNPNCSTAVCNEAQLAAHDLWVWEQQLDGTTEQVVERAGGQVSVTQAAALRQLRGCIVFTPDAGRANTGMVDVILQWQGMSESVDAVEAGDAVCGGGVALAAGEDESRRQMVVTSYVIDEAEL